MMTGESDETGRAVARGVARLLRDMGYGTLTEFRLRTGRRVDVVGVDDRGRVVVVEVKTSRADFRADGKWPEYRPFCDRFYFAVPQGFPREILPGDCGLIAADAYGGAVLRLAPDHPLDAARRRAMHLRFALAAAQRLQTLVDPGFGPGAGLLPIDLAEDAAGYTAG